MYNLCRAKKSVSFQMYINDLWRNLIYVCMRRKSTYPFFDRQPAVLNIEIVALTGLLNFNIRNNTVVPNRVTSHQKPPKNPPQPCHNRHRRHCLSSFSRFLVDFEQTWTFFYLNFNLLGDGSDKFLSRFKTNVELVVLFSKMPSALVNMIAFFTMYKIVDPLTWGFMADYLPCYSK